MAFDQHTALGILLKEGYQRIQIAQGARALVAIEMHGLVHRDLKPANLMPVEGPDLTVKVIDFRLAKAAATAGSETNITHAGFVGTPSFASPEQFTNAPVDVRSDEFGSNSPFAQRGGFL